ncbi:MAG TPA: hypothetical protein VGO60_17970, partial [Iamia sp.]|nr:hypothetical protein [Iamia sp.]
REGWWAGALVSTEYDDDFVHTFDPVRGAVPTVDATANACTVWSRVARDEPAGARRDRLVAAIGRAVGFLARLQRPDGAWTLSRSGPDDDRLPVRELSIRFAVLGLTDALRVAGLDPAVVTEAEAALERVEVFLLRTALDDGSGWNDRFDPTDSRHARAEPTALLLEPARRLAGLGDVAEGAAAAVARSLLDDEGATLVRSFWVPTWDGVAPTKLVWEQPRHAVAGAGVLAGPLDTPAAVAAARRVATTLVQTEVHGHWYDLEAAAAGEVIAFVSNTLLSLRALQAWKGAWVAPSA